MNQTFAIFTLALFLSSPVYAQDNSVIVQPSYVPWTVPFEPSTGVIYNSDGGVTTYTIPAPPWGWYPPSTPIPPIAPVPGVGIPLAIGQ